MFHVKHFGPIDGLGKRTFARRAVCLLGWLFTSGSTRAGLAGSSAAAFADSRPICPGDWTYRSRRIVAGPGKTSRRATAPSSGRWFSPSWNDP